MGFHGRFFRFLRKGLKILNILQYKTPPASEFTEPAVYVCRHSDNMGPVLTMANLPIAVHPWAYYVWCGEEECRRQCVEYTFTVRYGWSRRKAELVAGLIAKPFTALIRSAGAISVFRNSLRIRETFRESVDALKRGESLLIFPDVDYTAQEGETGTLYDGFLMLEKLYYKETGKHLPFIPVHISRAQKSLMIARPILFGESASFREEKERIIQQMQDALNELNQQYGV